MIRYYIHLFFDAGLRFWLDYLRSSELRKSYTASLDYQLEFYFIDSYKYHRQNGDSIRVSSLLAECDWTGVVDSYGYDDITVDRDGRIID